MLNKEGKPRMDYLTFKQQFDLKNPEKVYLIQGDQDYLTDQIKQQFIQLIPEEEREMNIGIYDMEEEAVGNAIGDAKSIPFFGERRLVIIKRPFFLTGAKTKSKVDHNLDDLIEYLKYPEPSTVLVIFAPYEKLDARKKVTKAVKTAAQVIDINQSSEQQVKRLVAEIVTDNGYQIEPSVVETIVQRTSANLTLIMNGLEKLFLYYQDTKVIEADVVADLVGQSMEQNVFDLVQLVLAKKVTKAIELYHSLLIKGEEPLRINAVLVQQFRLLLQVMILKKHGYSQGSLATSLKVHPYRIKLALQVGNKFNYQDLRRGYLGLIDLETSLKSTSQDPQFLFELFLLKFADVKASA